MASDVMDQESQECVKKAVPPGYFVWAKSRKIPPIKWGARLEYLRAQFCNKLIPDGRDRHRSTPTYLLLNYHSSPTAPIGWVPMVAGVRSALLGLTRHRGCCRCSRDMIWCVIYLMLIAIGHVDVTTTETNLLPVKMSSHLVGQILRRPPGCVSDCQQGFP